MISNEEYAKIVGKNLRRIMYERGVFQSQMARELGLAKTTISNWMRGVRTPRMDKIDLLCNYLNCSRADLMEPDTGTQRNISRGVKIPVLGRVVAGIPIDAVQDIIDYEEITEDMAQNGEYFALKIKGDSMNPRIMEGDIVIVRCQQDAESGSIVIAQINGDYATCKKLVKHKTGISLVSLNPAYEPMFFSNDEIQSLPVSIVGRVVENRQKY